jgi:hypothetical protein
LLGFLLLFALLALLRSLLGLRQNDRPLASSDGVGGDAPKRQRKRRQHGGREHGIAMRLD